MMIGARTACWGGGGFNNPYMTDTLTHMWHAPWNVSCGVQDKSNRVLNDLVGNAHFSLSSSASINDLSIYNNSISQLGGIGEVQIPTTEVAYMDVVFRYENSDANTALISTGTFRFEYFDRCFGLSNMKRSFVFGNKRVKDVDGVLNRFSYDFSSDKFYMEGIETSHDGISTLDANSSRGYGLYLMGFLNSGFKGHVCSIRFHNSTPSESYRMRCLELDRIFDDV